MSADKPEFELAGIVAELRSQRERWRNAVKRSLEPGGRELPSREALAAIVDGLRGALFPMRLGPPELRQDGEDYYVGHTLDTVLTSLLTQIRLELRYQARLAAARGASDVADSDALALELVRAFGSALPSIRTLLDSDVLAAYHG